MIVPRSAHTHGRVVASFHKDPKGRSPFWYVAYKNADGRQAFRSTKQRNLNLAQEVGVKWEREAAVLSSSKLIPSAAIRTFRNPNVILERFIEASQAAAQGVLTEALARRFVDELLTSVGEKAISGETARAFLIAWVDTKKASRAQGTYLRYKRTVDDFLEFLDKRADQPLAAITAVHLEGFQEQQIKEGKRSGTVDTSIKVLMAAFNKARRKGIITTNPVEALESIPRNSAHRRQFTLDELRRLLAVCDLDWKGMILAGYHLGMRIQDCASLTWEDVDFDRKVVHHRPQKERRDREAHKCETFLPEELRAFLRELGTQRRKRTGALFPSLLGKTSGGDFGLSLTFRGLLDKAAIKYRDVSNGKGRRFYDLGFHSLRHTCVSVMANAGVSEELRKEHVGHSSDVHRRYTHLQISTFERALEGVPRLLDTSHDPAPSPTTLPENAA